MSLGILSLAGAVLPVVAVFGLIVLVSIFRRGSALATGLMGAGLLLIGLILPGVVGTLAVLLGNGTSSAIPDDPALQLVITIGPKVVEGAGFILVAIAAVARPRPSRPLPTRPPY